MKYMGSKARHAKHILPIILKDRKPDQWYVEPFVGGANVIDKVTGNRIGADANPYQISLLKALQRGWLPPMDVSESDYLNIKNNIGQYPDFMVAYAGIQLSYGAIWFGSYRRDSIGKRNYSHEAYRNVSAQAPLLDGIDLRFSDYRDLYIPADSVIYCDPPYANSSGYSVVGEFDTQSFWAWCEHKVSEGHTVFVSEYEAPDGWACVWSKEVNSSLSKNTGAKKATEKLFTKSGILRKEE